MKTSLKASLESAMNQWLEDQEAHNERPAGLACEDLGELMANAAASAYDASHAGAVMGAKDPASCGVE